MTHTAHVIEVGNLTAGIAVATTGGFRFFASEKGVRALDQALFPSLAQATRAVRDKLARQQRS